MFLMGVADLNRIIKVLLCRLVCIVRTVLDDLIDYRSEKNGGEVFVIWGWITEETEELPPVGRKNSIGYGSLAEVSLPKNQSTNPSSLGLALYPS